MSDISKLRWRCRRGCLELDLLFITYLERHYAQASEQEKTFFQELAQKDDTEILNPQNNYLNFLKSHQ